MGTGFYRKQLFTITIQLENLELQKTLDTQLFLF